MSSASIGGSGKDFQRRGLRSLPKARKHDFVLSRMPEKPMAPIQSGMRSIYYTPNESVTVFVRLKIRHYSIT
jgi:thymidylate kinase